MTDELFDELMESVREGGAILRGEIAPSRRREILRKQPNSIDFFIVGALSVLAFVMLVPLAQERCS